VLARLRALNPAAPIFPVAHGALAPAQILDCGLYDPKTKSADVARWLKAEAYAPPHDHDRDDHGAPDVNRHDASIRAFCITRAAPFTPQSLQACRSISGPTCCG
jgi:G3E family GTPase